MYIRRHILASLIAFLSVMSSNLFCQSNSDIIYALKTANIEKLVTFFDEEIEIQINNDVKTYALADAETRLKSFFKTFSVISYKSIHEGTAGQSVYFIGELKTTSANYRLYVYYKLKNSKKRIYQLIFETNE